MGSKVLYRVLTKRRPESQLVKGQTLSSCLLNPRPRRLREPQRRYLQCRHLLNPNVVRHRPDDHCDLSLLLSIQKSTILTID